MAHPKLANSVTDVFELSSHEKERSWKSAQQEIKERLTREDKEGSTGHSHTQYSYRSSESLGRERLWGHSVLILLRLTHHDHQQGHVFVVIGG